MTIAYNFVTYDATAGRREDVLDLITQISPEETPFLSRLGISQAFSINHEWNQDSLTSGTATGGAVVEGASASHRALSDRTRLKNYTQITDYVGSITGSQEAVAHFGLDSEYSYQLEKGMKILKIMMEQILLNSTSSTGGMGSTCATGARKLTGLINCIQTSVCTGSAGVCALTESMFNKLLQAIFEEGGNPDIVYTAGFNKRRISSFATSNARYQEVGPEGRIRNKISFYESKTEIALNKSDYMLETPKRRKLQGLALTDNQQERSENLLFSEILRDYTSDTIAGEDIVQAFTKVDGFRISGNWKSSLTVTLTATTFQFFKLICLR